jgi:hypothetical protein
LSPALKKKSNTPKLKGQANMGCHVGESGVWWGEVESSG